MPLVLSSEAQMVRDTAMAFFPELSVESDGAHAFYLGGELTKAETAFRLVKAANRIAETQPLSFR